MKKELFFILLAAVFSVWSSAKAQSYSIETLEGQKVEVKLTEKSWYKGVISYRTDSLFLSDYNGAKEVHILGGRFLEIVYEVRGGTGSQFRNTVILCVKKNKINVAAFTNSYSRAFGDDMDGSLYVIKYKLTGSNTSNFSLTANIYDRHKSISKPQNSYIKNTTATLKFDSVQNIFYSVRKNINRLFTVIDPKTEQSSKQQINGSVPVIVLGQDNYYYIKGGWYELGHENTLLKNYYN